MMFYVLDDEDYIEQVTDECFWQMGTECFQIICKSGVLKLFIFFSRLLERRNIKLIFSHYIEKVQCSLQKWYV